MSKCMVLPYGHHWIKGNVSLSELQDELAQEYGKDVKMWLVATLDNIKNASVIGAIYSCINAADNLKKYLGVDDANLMIHEGPLLIDCLPVSETTDKEKMATLRAQCDPFKTISSTSSEASAGNSQALTARELADAIAANNNHKEAAKLHSRVLKTMAMFSPCVFYSKEAGTLKSLDLPIPTEAMLNCMKTTYETEWVNEMA